MHGASELVRGAENAATTIRSVDPEEVASSVVSGASGLVRSASQLVSGLVSGGRSAASGAATLLCAEKAASAQHARIVGIAGQLGWMLLVLSEAPFVYMVVTGTCLECPDAGFTPVAGSFTFYATALPWGLALAFLIVRPTDGIMIRRVGRCFCFFCFFFAIVLVSQSIQGIGSRARTVPGSPLPPLPSPH